MQIAVSTLNESCPVWATRNVPRDVCKIAAEPTAASAEPPSIVTDTVRPLTVPDTDGRGGAVDDGEEGLPHAASPAAAASEANWQAEAQNSRRVGGEIV